MQLLDLLDAQQRLDRRQVRDLSSSEVLVVEAAGTGARPLRQLCLGQHLRQIPHDVGGLARRRLTRRLGPPTPRFGEVDAPLVAERVMSIEVEPTPRSSITTAAGKQSRCIS